MAEFPTLQDLITFGREKGFARTERFAVQFTTPKDMTQYKIGLKDLTLLCEEAAFPGKTIGTRTLRINALNEQRAETVDYMGDSITFQFLVDNSWGVRKFFEDWLSLCVGDHNTREVGEYSSYITDVTIFALSQTGSTEEPEAKTYELILREAWPRAINVQQIAYGTIGYHKLNVTFTYKYWETVARELPDQPMLTEAQDSTDIIDQLRDQEEKILPGAMEGAPRFRLPKIPPYRSIKLPPKPKFPFNIPGSVSW